MNIEFIKSLRTENNYSQDFVAKEIGMSRASYILVEQGKKDLCLGELEKLVKLYRVNIEDLIADNKKKQQKYEQMFFAFLRELDRDKRVPKTKLAKLLYLSDFAWFYFHHESMSGLQYRKIAHGPVPDYYFRLVEELDGDGKILVEPKGEALLISETRVGQKVGDDLLSKEEKKLIKNIASNWINKSTKEIVDFAHSQIPYTFADKGDMIPYELITQEEPEHVY